MKALITISFFFLAGLALAQPVTRIRLITLQNPPDTTTQYFIQAGGGRDTIKYVPVDSIGGGGENIYTSDGTLTSARTLTMNNETLTIDMDTGVTIGDTIAIRIIAPDGEVNGWYISDADGPVALIVNAMYSTDIHKLISHTIGSTHVIEVGNTSDTLKISADKLFLNELNMATDNTVTQILGYKSSTDEIVFTDGSGTGAAGSEGYAVVETAAEDLQTISSAAWEALEAQTSSGLSSGWSFSTTTDLLTYSGSTAKYLVNFSACFTDGAATLRDYTFTVRENGTDGNARALQRTSGVDADVAYCVSGMDVVTANSGDTFGLGFISNSASTSNIRIHSSQLVMTKLVGQ